jgi:hypothetical protein
MTRPALPRLARPRLGVPHFTVPRFPVPHFPVPHFPVPRFAGRRLARPHLPQTGLERLALPHLAGPDIVANLRARKPLAVAAAAVLAVAVVDAGLAFGGTLATPAHSASPSPSAYIVQVEPTAAPTLTPTPTLNLDLLTVPTAGPTATPIPADVAATTNGVLLPWYDADLATRKAIIVMFDDHWSARPQAGLSQADVVYQAVADGGVPRYMAVFQTRDPPFVGPIRSARPFFVAWAEEWQKPMFVHIGGSELALSRLAVDNKAYIWDAEGLRLETITRYMWRVDWRVPPHNVYSNGGELRGLARKLGATAPLTSSLWTFGDPTPEWLRPEGGTITVPYHYNLIDYRYDRATNTYPRWVTDDPVKKNSIPQVDANNGHQIAPSVVVVMYVPTYLYPGSYRLDVRYLGQGEALVFQNGTVIDARWAKSREQAATTFRYASGPEAGRQIPLNRGQIFIQIVAPDTPVTWTLGLTTPPEY